MIRFGNKVITWASVNSFLRQAGAVFGLVVAVANNFHLSGALRSDIVIVSGALLTAEHYANAQNPATPPQSTATALNPTNPTGGPS